MGHSATAHNKNTRQKLCISTGPHSCMQVNSIQQTHNLLLKELWAVSTENLGDDKMDHSHLHNKRKKPSLHAGWCK